MRAFGGFVALAMLIVCIFQFQNAEKAEKEEADTTITSKKTSARERQARMVQVCGAQELDPNYEELCLELGLRGIVNYPRKVGKRDDKCLSEDNVVVVVSRYREVDLKWLNEQPYCYVVMEKNRPSAAPFNTDFNKGCEASSYLQFILDNYDSLPSTEFIILINAVIHCACVQMQVG